MATKLVNPNAAGIDVASNEHVVAVPEDKAKESVHLKALQETCMHWQSG